MEQTVQIQSTFAALFDPEVARALADRAAHWNLPRTVCRPLDRYVGARVNAATAAYDAEVEHAEVELAALPEEEIIEAIHATPTEDDDADF